MIAFSHPLVLLLLPPAVAFILWVWRTGYINLRRRRRAVALSLRLIIITLAVLSLAGLTLRLPQSREAVVFVADRSASDAGSQSAMEALINSSAQRRPNSDVLGVVSVGRTALVEQPVSALSSFDGFQSQVDPNYTNLESGLELASALLPNGYRKRVVLLTDGQQNIGDAMSATRLLQSEGIRVDVVPVRSPGGPDVRVDAVTVPLELRTQQRFDLTVSLHSNVATSARLDVYRDRALLLSRQERIVRGEHSYTFGQTPLGPGFHTFQVQITPQVDSQPENNSGSAFTSVQGPPHVLIIATTPQEADNVAASLRSTGIAVDVRSPDQVVPSLETLQSYAGIVIVDSSADALGPDLIKQLVPYVRDLGRGLLVIGGQDAYALGAYGHTPLEQVLPVQMELPKRKDLPSAAVVLVIESLEAQLPIDISKEAGKGVVKLLTEQDKVGVEDVSDDPTAGWAVPLQPVISKQAIDNAITQMIPGDPDSYTAGLLAAYDALRQTHARIKHIIVLGDGDAVDPRYQQLVRRIHAGGVTVSTVVTNAISPDDYRTMRDIARWGGGRYYQADNPNAIPRIFLREARTIVRSGIVVGKFYPQRLSANPMLRDLKRIPPLYGYVTTATKPAGELILASHKLDPILAGWQLGLGRSVAWTSDAAGLWTRDWLAAPGANRFWADLVDWTLPATDSGHLFLTGSSAQGRGEVAVDPPSNLGVDPTVTAHVVAPDQHSSTVQLQPSAPGHYRGAFPAPEQGAYLITVEARGAGHAAVGRGGIDVPYSAEYRVTGTNLPFLRTLAHAGGGSIVAGPESIWLDNLSPVYDQRSLTNLLWLLALLLLPLDIAIRRLIITRRDLAALRAAIFGTPVEEAAGPLPRLAPARATPSRPTIPASSVTPVMVAVASPATPRPPRPGTRGVSHRPAPAGRDAGAPGHRGPGYSGSTPAPPGSHVSHTPSATSTQPPEPPLPEPRAGRMQDAPTATPAPARRTRRPAPARTSGRETVSQLLEAKRKRR